MLASPADGDESHLRGYQLAERSPDASLTCIAITCAHLESDLLAARAGPLWPVLGVDELTSEAPLELLGVRALGEAEDVHVGVIATEGIAAGAQRQVLTEKTDGD